MGSEALENLRRIVVDKPFLRDRLLATTDRDTFITEAVEVASELGIGVSGDDVVAGLDEAEHYRLARWV